MRQSRPPSERGLDARTLCANVCYAFLIFLSLLCVIFMSFWHRQDGTCRRKPVAITWVLDSSIARVVSNLDIQNQ